MPQDNPPLLDKTMNTTEQTPRNLADVLASGLANIANNVKPDGSDISIDVPGMSATNVNDGFSELKGTLDDKVDKIDTTGIKVFHGNGTHQYCKVATITITNTYAGRPIVFELAGRAIEYATIQVEFNNANNTDPTLKSFKTSGTQTNYYIKKTATSTWEIYCDIINTYAYLYLFREIEPRDYDNITVTINMTGVTALPSGCTQVTSILDDLQSVITIGSDADFINVLDSMSVYEVKPVFFKASFIQPWFNSGYQNYGGYMVKHTGAIADGFGFDSGVGNAIVFRGTKSGTPATLNVTKQKKVTFTDI